MQYHSFIPLDFSSHLICVHLKKKFIIIFFFYLRGLLTIDGSPYFTDYLDIVFDLYVLVTTANSPDVM